MQIRQPLQEFEEEIKIKVMKNKVWLNEKAVNLSISPMFSSCTYPLPGRKISFLLSTIIEEGKTISIKSCGVMTLWLGF